MRSTLLLLLPLVACSSKPQATEKPQEAKPQSQEAKLQEAKPQEARPQGVDPLLQVGPYVKSVVSGSDILEPSGDFFRAVLANSEYDGCLRVDRVNLRVSKELKLKEARRYCTFTHGKENLSLEPGDVQDAEISKLSWKKFELSFELSYLGAGPGASPREFRCTLDPQQAQNKVLCTLKPDADSAE